MPTFEGDPCVHGALLSFIPRAHLDALPDPSLYVLPDASQWLLHSIKGEFLVCPGESVDVDPATVAIVKQKPSGLSCSHHTRRRGKETTCLHVQAVKMHLKQPTGAPSGTCEDDSDPEPMKHPPWHSLALLPRDVGDSVALRHDWLRPASELLAAPVVLEVPVRRRPCHFPCASARSAVFVHADL
jgi:hypothetical protein